MRQAVDTNGCWYGSWRRRSLCIPTCR